MRGKQEEKTESESSNTFFGYEFKLDEGRLLAIGSVAVGLGAWQYSKGYFSALGIEVSYSFLDNLIFAFDRVVSISVKPSSSISFGVAFFLFAFLLGVANILFAYTHSGRKKANGKNSDEKEVQKSSKKRTGTFVPLLTFSIFYLLVFGLGFIGGGSSLTAILMLVVLVLSLRIYFAYKDRPEEQFNALRPAFRFLFVLAVLYGLFQVGRQDARALIKSEYVRSDTICFLDPKSSGQVPRAFLSCGKKVYQNDTFVCARENGYDYAICRLRTNYETIVSPSEP